MFEIAYFRNINTFDVIGKAKVLSYDIDICAYNKTVSTMTVEGRLLLPDICIVQMGKYLFMLDACTPSTQDEISAISLKPFFTIFDRAIPYVAQSTIYEQLVTDITDQFTNCADPRFRYSWLGVQSAAISMNYVKPEVDETGRYNLLAYIEQIAADVIGYCYATTQTIIVRFWRRAFPPDENPSDYPEMTTHEYIPFYDATAGKDIVTSASFTQSLISKITHFDPDNQTSTDYYLLDDGTVTTNMSATNRVDGKWIVYSASNVNDGLIAAQFARSRYSHSIELKAPIGGYTYMNGDSPYYYARCRIKLPGGQLVESRVTSVRLKSQENGMLNITAGRSLTKLSEIVQEVRNARN